MKSWMWCVFVAAVTFVVLAALDLPFLVAMALVWPVILVTFIYGSFRYSYRPSLTPQPIDTGRDAARVQGLNREAPAIEAIGFRLTDAFYLKTIPDVLTYAFVHETHPVVLCLYHFGPKMATDIVSWFAGDTTLTTCSRIEGGMSPRPAKHLLQIRPDASYQTLFDSHILGLDYLASRGLEEIAPPGQPRDLLMKSLREYEQYIRSMLLWPLRLLWWTVTKHGKRYATLIEQQSPLLELSTPAGS